MATNIMNNNPQAAAFMNQMQSQCGNGNPKDFVLNMCRQNGVADNVPLALAAALGIDN